MDIRGPLFDRTQAGKGADLQGRLAKSNPVDRAEPQASDAQQVVARHSPSRAMLQLAAKLQQIPEVRDEVLARVSERLVTGYYLSMEAAEKTAEVLSSDPF